MCFVLLSLLSILSLNDITFASKEDFFNFSARDIKTSKDVPMSLYSGKVVLVVNVASACGFTDSHYKELVELQNKFNKDFIILGFPCNQFGNQEPTEEEEIVSFVQEMYEVNFPMFRKVNTVGNNAHPIYKWLKKESFGNEPNWNFCKYLLDRNGKVVRFANPNIFPLQMERDILKLLDGEDLEGSITDVNMSYNDEL